MSIVSIIRILNKHSQDLSNVNSQEISTSDTPSFNSEFDSDMDLTESFNETTRASCECIGSISHNDTSQNGDRLPKSFLQLKGIMIGNYNMGCNFHILAALRIMLQYKLVFLAIQEHTAWNRVLAEHEISSIVRNCDRWGYFVTMSKLQIVIIEKQLLACHCETKIEKEGRIILSRFQNLKSSLLLLFWCMVYHTLKMEEYILNT